MGHEKEDQEEIQLIQYIYRNQDLIDSLYSQINAGDLVDIAISSSSSESKEKKVKASAKIIEGETSSAFNNQKGYVKNSLPKDFKIAELLRDLEPNSDQTSFSDGQVIKVAGSLSIFSKQYIQNLFSKIVPLMGNDAYSNLVDDFARLSGRHLSVSNSAKPTKGKEIFNTMMEILPYNLHGILFCDTTPYECLIDEEGFSIAPEVWLNTFGDTMPGNHIIIGIYHSFPTEALQSNFDDPNKKVTINANYQALLGATSLITHFGKFTNSSGIIVPIVIFKEIS